MKNGKIIVEEAVYSCKGESNSFYGYFDSPEQAVAWIQKNCPGCETVEENQEYQTFSWDGGTTWIIRDADNEDFKEYCAMMKADDRACFNEADMFPIE